MNRNFSVNWFLSNRFLEGYSTKNMPTLYTCTIHRLPYQGYTVRRAMGAAVEHRPNRMLPHTRYLVEYLVSLTVFTTVVPGMPVLGLAP